MFIYIHAIDEIKILLLSYHARTKQLISVTEQTVKKSSCKRLL